jgi:hypothetical protein
MVSSPIVTTQYVEEPSSYRFFYIKPGYGMHSIDAALASNRIKRRDADLIKELITKRKVAESIGE